MAGMTRRQLLGRSLGAAATGVALVGGGAMLPKLLATTAEADTTPASAASAGSTSSSAWRPGRPASCA